MIRLLPAIHCTLLVCYGISARAGELRALPEGRLPDERRLGELRSTNTTIPFVPSPNCEHWNARAERLHRQGMVALGLWPAPTPTPLKAVVHGRVERDTYTVQKVFFESLPGHFVTGNLYRPRAGGTGRRAAVLCPYGHWRNGRFADDGPRKVQQQIAAGQEKFEIGGRYPLQARCVQLARMGCVVFHWDMIGYCDSVQLPHRPVSRPEMNTATDWGLVSPQAELHLQTLCGLQLYNAMRAVDFVSGLPDVDPERIAVTGASGGGMQSTLLAAFDRRVTVSVPAVWVSTTLHGGCSCNMAPYLRVDEGNVGLAALIAPRPLLLIGANDWTLHVDTQGYPDLKRHYTLLGHPEHVAVRVFPEFPHNYNYHSRAVMYAFLNKMLHLGQDEPIVEEDFQPLSTAQMSVWNDLYPRPSGDAVGDAYQRALLRWLTEDSRRQMDRLIPRDRATLAEFRRIVGGAVDVMIGRGLPDPAGLELKQVAAEADEGYRQVVGLLNHAAAGEQLPVLLLEPPTPAGRTVVWVSPEGKSGLLNDAGRPRPAVRRLLQAGCGVAGVDLLWQGEFIADGQPLTETRIGLDSKRKPCDHPDFTFAFNSPVFSKRVHDLLSVVAYLKGRTPEKTEVNLIGLSGAGHWAAAARAQAGGAIRKAAIDTDGFRFARLTSVRHPDFLPGGAKYHDLPGMLALSAPYPLWLAGEGDRVPPVVAATYRAASAEKQLTLFVDTVGDTEQAAVDWLLRP